MRMVSRSHRSLCALSLTVDSIHRQIEAMKNLLFPLLRSKVDDDVIVRCKIVANIPKAKYHNRIVNDESGNIFHK